MNENSHLEFIALDWRNRCIANISTDPSATTNYFQAPANSLPYELSPAFFRPDVLALFKSNREKYTIDERSRTIKRRGSLWLRSFDINDAGQVGVYICDLRGLSYQDKLYWRSFNEKPKATVSQRALKNDFHGVRSQDFTPLDQVWLIVNGWALSGVPWWKLRDKVLLEQINTPLTSNPDEWARAFVDLQKLIVEGFELRTIRAKLKELKIFDCDKDKNRQSLALLEILVRQTNEPSDQSSLKGLKTVHNIRNKVVHTQGTDIEKLKEQSLRECGTYTAHFNNVCRTVIQELTLIENSFK